MNKNQRQFEKMLQKMCSTLVGPLNRCYAYVAKKKIIQEIAQSYY